MSAQPIAAVAAMDRKTALAAIAAIKIDSERLPAVIGLDEARKADAPVVFEKPDRKKAGNVSEGGGSPAPWKGNIRGPSAAFSQEAEDRCSSWVGDARATRTIRCWSRARSAPARNRMPASSRMPRSPVSTATY